MALFESYDRREPQILAVLKNYGIGSIEECAEICKAKGLDIYKLVEGIQPICFENAKWAYTVGCAIAIRWITTQVRLRKYSASLTLTVFVLRLTATALTT